MSTPRPLAHATVPTPLGDMLLAASAQGLCGAWFTQGQRDSPTTTAWGPPAPAHPLLVQAARELGEYFAGQRRTFGVALDLSAGTAFQQAVWRALPGIEAGRSQSYGQLAAGMGRPRAVRAVGAAVGANPVSVIVPCHRVLGAGGTLTGYAGGLHRKAALLRLEGWRIDPIAPGRPGHDSAAGAARLRVRAPR